MPSRKNKKKNSFTKLALIALILVGLPAGIFLAQKNTENRSLSATAVATEAGISTGGGFQYLDPAEQGRQLDHMKLLGVRWIRIDLPWADIQSAGPTSYNWTRYDNTVNMVNSRGIKILGILAYTPEWARPANCTASDKCAPANPTDFANFAGQAASHFAPFGVNHWEIWNEANITNFWQPAPNVEAYTTMLKAAYPVIKQANPSAIVLTTGSSPASSDGANISPIDFLSGIYANGGQGSFDAVAHHPYCFVGTEFNCPSAFATWSAWSQMQDTNPSLRSIMIANGDSYKKVWATEFGAPTSGSQAVSETQQAQMVTEAYNLFKSYDWSGPLFWYNFNDNCNDVTNRECWFGLVRYDSSKKPAYDSYKTAVGSPDDSSVTSIPISTHSQPHPSTSPQVIDRARPYIKILSPINGVKIGRDLNIAASAKDNVKVSKLLIWLNGKLIKANANSNKITSKWNTTRLPQGAHTITVKAIDAAGNIGQSTITIYK